MSVTEHQAVARSFASDSHFYLLGCKACQILGLDSLVFVLVLMHVLCGPVLVTNVTSLLTEDYRRRAYCYRALLSLLQLFPTYTYFPKELFDYYRALHSILFGSLFSKTSTFI